MFFEKHYGYIYTLEDKKLFVNLWFLLIVISDVLCIVGTGIKIAITFHVSILDCKTYVERQILQPTCTLHMYAKMFGNFSLLHVCWR